MENENFYYEVPNPAQKESIINKLLDEFIIAREKADFPVNSKGFDEDVNLYIGHLLFAVSMPNYSSITEQYISFHNAEVNVLADMAEDSYLKYFIYKVNADNLLIHLGIYQDLSYRDYHKALHTDVIEFIDDAKEFYGKAIQLNKKIYKRKTAIADVLVKLAKNIDLYIKALMYMRKSFFQFLNRFEDDEFSSFLDHMKLYERKMEFTNKQNVFLDLYSRWLKDKSDSLRSEINKICTELHDLDPSFNFNLD